MDAMTLNPFDATVYTILIVSAILSVMRGFTTEALKLAAYMAAIFVTFQMHPLVAPFAHDFISPSFMANGVTYFVLAVVSLVTFHHIAHKLGTMVQKSGLGALDRALGLLFGLLRGTLIISITYMMLSAFFTENKMPEWFKTAKSLPLVEYGASIVNVINPYHDELALQKHLDDIKSVKELRDKSSAFPIERDNNEKTEPEYNSEETRKEMNNLIEENL